MTPFYWVTLLPRSISSKLFVIASGGGEANVYGSSYYWNFRTSSFKQVACLILKDEVLLTVSKLNTGIGLRNRERLFPVLSIIKKKKEKKINPDRPTLDFLTCDSKPFPDLYRVCSILSWVNCVRFWLWYFLTLTFATREPVLRILIDNIHKAKKNIYVFTVKQLRSLHWKYIYKTNYKGER
jgi:hypothetical protein